LSPSPIQVNCHAANERRERETVVYAECNARRYLRGFTRPTASQALSHR
jgi:hypothetical protein